LGRMVGGVPLAVGSLAAGGHSTTPVRTVS
jgi:hypothetical protein